MQVCVRVRACACVCVCVCMYVCEEQTLHVLTLGIKCTPHTAHGTRPSRLHGTHGARCPRGHRRRHVHGVLSTVQLPSGLNSIRL